MNYKRTLKLLNILCKEDIFHGDVYLIVNRIESKIAEIIAKENFTELAKEYFSEEEIKEMLRWLQ